jgi:hypothetical protein
MKKSNMVLMVVAVIMAATSIVRAEGFGVDFDRGSFRTADFVEAAKTSDVVAVDNAASIESVPPTAVNTVTTAVYELATPALLKLRKEVLNMPGLSKGFLQQINEEKTIVLYNEDNVFLTILVGNTRYIILESNDNELIGFLAKQKTEGLQKESQNKNLLYVCLTKIETIMKWVNYVWTAVQISREVCSWQNDGVSPGTALPGGSGSTWNSGQGGDSNYDVNKHLK